MLKKSYTLFFVVLLFALTTASAYGADFNDLTKKYMAACQNRDLKTLFDTNIYYQMLVSDIRRKSPKFMVDTEVQNLFEKEKNALEYINKFHLFTPSMKWKLVETQYRPGAYDNHYGKVYTIYISMVYSDINTSPIINDRPVKQLIASIDFSANRKQYMGVGDLGLNVLDKGLVYWELPQD
jgi:hypothetical protein